MARSRTTLQIFNEGLINNNKTMKTGLNNNTAQDLQSSRRLSSDKIFIKNQLKNEVANFSGYNIGDEGAKLIADLLLSHQFSPTKRNNKVKEIKLSKCGITDEGFSTLANSLEKNPLIHTVHFSKNKLKDDSYTNILKLIKNRSLKSLNLTQNNFTQGIKEKIKLNAKNLNQNLKIEI